MSKKRTANISMALALLLLFLSITGVGCGVIKQGLMPQTKEQPRVSSGTLTELPSEFSVLKEAWQVLNKYYVDKDKLDAKKLSQGAVRGMLESLGDPYSSYVSPEVRKLEQSSLVGQYEGIGAYIGVRDKQLIIISPIDGSPAEAAGIKPDDIILEINGEPTKGISATEAALKIQGPKGTLVTLLILHKGANEPIKIEIVRSEIKLKSVFVEMRDDIAYVRISQFLASTGRDLRALLEKEVLGKKAKGIILDLRNNPGGLLDSAIAVASEFLSMGIVVDVVDNRGVHEKQRVKPGGMATQLPLVVLVNNASASSSEIVAGAIQDYGRGKLAGVKTHGKGSVQIIRNLEDGSAVHVTVAKWFTPLGHPIDGVGLTPDYELQQEGDALVNWAVDYLKDKIAGK